MIVVNETRLGRLFNKVSKHLGKIYVLLCFITLCVAYTIYISSQCLCGARSKETQIEIGKIDQAVQQYKIMNNQQLPGSLDDLEKQKFLPKVPRDPWNTTYYYFMSTNNTYIIFSAGPDGEPLTADDITAADKKIK